MDGSSPASPSLPPLHPAIAPLSFLLGKWRGEGEGGFPTINSFAYGEELLFSHSGKPVIAYNQKTWKLASGEPLHAESGYWKPKPDGTIEVVIAQSTGLVEVQKGSYDAKNMILTLRSALVGNASKVKEISREFKVVNGELSYVVQMATTLNSLQPHLKALLRKVFDKPTMGKNKGGATAHWNQDMTMFFIDLCLEQRAAGNMPTTHFNKQGWNMIMKKFNGKQGTQYDRSQFKNKWDQLKKDWKMWRMLLGSETGLGWDSSKRTVAASSEWWEERTKDNPQLKKFKTIGIPPCMEEKLHHLFSSVVATGVYGYSPNSGVFSRDDVELMGDSDDGHGSEPTESGSESRSNPSHSKKRRNSKEKEPCTNKILSSGKPTPSSVSPDVLELPRITDTITTTAASWSAKRYVTPRVSDAMAEIERLFVDDEELMFFAIKYVLVKAQREAWMCMKDDLKVLWLKKEMKEANQ